MTRSLHRLRGEWRLERGDWSLAADSLQEAVAMAQAVGQRDHVAEAQLLLAKFHLGQLDDPQSAATRLAREPHGLISLWVARLWLAGGDAERAKVHALAAYTWAWADGDPYVFRYYLDNSRALLAQLGSDIPSLPAYDRAKDEKLSWEDALEAALEELRRERGRRIRRRRCDGAGAATRRPRRTSMLSVISV